MLLILKCYFGIISATMNDFSTWLNNELNARNWNQAELHRKSGMSRTVISNVIAEKVFPGFEFCIGVAKALDLPPEFVMRKAGLLPPAPTQNEKTERLLYLFDQLSERDRDNLLMIASALLDQEKRGS